MNSTDAEAAAPAMLAAMRMIAQFPDNPEHRDLTFSQAVACMAALASAAIARATGG